MLYAILGDKANVAHAVNLVAEEGYKQVAAPSKLVAHGFKTQIQPVLRMIPEGLYKPGQVTFWTGDRYAITDHVIRRDR